MKCGDVYIIFGDESRSDDCNIYGIHTSLKTAEEEVRILEDMKHDTTFSIVRRDLEE